MKRRVAGYIAVGLLAYLLFLVATAPAALLATALQRASGGALVLQALSGTVWSGNGELVFQRQHTGAHSFGQGHWSVNPLWLFAGRVHTDLNFATADSRISATADVGIETVSLKRVDAQFSAPVIGALYAPAAFIAPDGAMTLAVANLRIDKKEVSGEARLDWRNATSNLSPVKPLGDYRLSANGQGRALQIKMETLSGALLLSGAGQWGIDDNRLRFDLLAKARERADELAPMLRLIGREQPNGDRSLTIDVRLR